MSGDPTVPARLPQAGAAHPATERRVRRDRRRLSAGLAAAALLAGSVPASATAAEDGATDGPAPDFAYALTATATPLRVEIYEPTIPIPVPAGQPQIELNLPYSVVEGSSGQAAARASYLWPGDSVGEGAKTFGESLMLPPQIFEDGYRPQVNASTTGEPQESDEPFPGTVQRASATPERAVARAGFSTDGQVGDRAGGPGEGDGGDAGDGGGAPGLPDLPTGDDLLGELGAALGGGSSTIPVLPGGSRTAAADEPPPSGPFPEALAAVVDVDGGASTSILETAGPGVASIGRSALGEVTLLGGTVVLDGLSGSVALRSDGGEPVAEATTSVGGITIAGTRFAFDEGGPVAAGQRIPGLPDDPTAALAAIGVSLGTPKVVTETADDGTVTARVSALRVELDLTVLKQALSAVPIGSLIDAVPQEAAELKKQLQTIAGLAPRFVLLLGTAKATATVLGPIVPTTPGAGEEPTTDGGTSAPGGGGGAAPAGTSGGGAAPAVGGAPAAGGAAAGGDVPALEATPLGAGLPPLTTVPGALLFGGILGAIVAGSWLRRMGLVVLGGGAACGHGLETGVPDLRKA